MPISICACLGHNWGPLRFSGLSTSSSSPEVPSSIALRFFTAISSKKSWTPISGYLLYSTTP